jgi:molybdopterin-containing oxidoreductase family iron-sulfur binding subunit
MQDKGRGLSRREFIKRAAGTVGFAAVLASPIVVLNRVRATGEPGQFPSDPSGAPAAAGGGNGRSARAWAMVIDLKRCDGCIGLGIPPQCLQACILGHFVPKGQHWIQVYHAELPGGGTFFLPTPCYHCENAPCINVCPVAATYHTDEGVVLIDQRRCIGCRFCMAACPYHRRFFNWGEPELPPEALAHDYSPTHQVPAMKGTVMKCDFCPDLLAIGQFPYCVAACPRKVIYMADLNSDLASNGVEVAKASTLLREGDAFRQSEDLGTQPRVWYLPGHGQEFGRRADDERELFPAEWSWGGPGFDYQVDVFPWNDAEAGNGESR